MPLFKKSTQPTPAAAPAVAPRASHETRQSGGLFSKHRSSTSTAASDARTSTSSTSSSTGGIGGVFKRGRGEDPSISAARQRVSAAEQAERQADAALVQARNAVREAHAHVRQLELEAEEEARLAKIKQGQAKDLHNRAKPLGRHGLN